MTEQERPVIGGFYRHFKNKLYQVLNVAVHADTEEELVIYQALYGDFKVYARPLKDFMSEVDHEKYPDVTQKMRFLKVTLKKMEEVKAEPKEEPLEETIELPKDEVKKVSEVMEIEEEPATVDGVHPILLRFLDAEDVEERLEVFKEMNEVADQRMLDAVAASLDISLPGSISLDESYELIFDNLVTQKRYEGSRRR